MTGAVVDLQLLMLMQWYQRYDLHQEMANEEDGVIGGIRCCVEV